MKVISVWIGVLVHSDNTQTCIHITNLNKLFCLFNNYFKLNQGYLKLDNSRVCCCFVGEECFQHDGQGGQEEVHQLSGCRGKRQRSRRFDPLKI